MIKPPFQCFFLTASIALSVYGCGYQAQPDQNPVDAAPPAVTPTKPIPPEALYSLLVAEIATHRGQMDVALANYYQQAYKTRDPGVARRATLLAEYLQASQAALDLAQLWSETDPENPEPVYLAGRYLVEFKRLDQAVIQSQRLLEMNAKTLFVPIALSPAPADPKTQTSLLSQYSSLLEKHPYNIDLLLGNAALLSQQENYDASLAMVERALRVDNKHLPARLFEVDILFKSGRPDRALKKMSNIVEDDPENNRLRMQYAKMLTDQDLEKAREQFDYLAMRNSLEPDLLLSRALVYFNLKDYPQAKDLFEQLLFLKQHIDTAQYYLAEIAIINDKPGRAIEHFRRVNAGNEYIPAATKAFDLMSQQNRRLEGQQWLADQRKLYPENSLKLYMVEANVLLKSGDTKRCMAALDEAIKIHPSVPELHYARFLLLEREGNIPAAISELRIVVQLQPDNVNALNALGYLLADNNLQLDESHKLLIRAIALSPDNPAVLDSMGWLLFRMNKNDEAILRLKKSFALEPNDEVAAHLGEVLWRIGQQEEAVAIWQQGLRIKPDSEIIRETRTRLQPGNIFK